MNYLQKLIILIIVFLVLLFTYQITRKTLKTRKTLEKETIVIAQLKEDLSDNYLNYIDKPSWLTSQALRLIIPPLIDYQSNCYPTSKILKKIPSLNSNTMYLQNKQTILIFQKFNFKTTLISPLNIIPTIQLLNLDNISTKWVYINLVESIDTIEKINQEDIRIRYKVAYSLPYFPSPVIFDNYNIHKSQIQDYTYKNLKNFPTFPQYSEYKLLKSKTNYFLIQNTLTKQKILFLTYTNINKLEKDLNKIDILNIPPTLKNYYKLPPETQIITLPNKEMYFIHFNPNIPKNQRLSIYYLLKQKIKKYQIKNYILNNTYILPYHFAAKSFDLNLTKQQIYHPKNLKVLITYQDQKSELFSNLLSEILEKDFNCDVLKSDIRHEAPKKGIFGTLIDPPEIPLKEIINPYNFDFIITSITFLPYINYYSIYSKEGKYNIYSTSTPEIEDLLNKVMQGFSNNQKEYLIELQEKLYEQALILPLAIDTQTFIIKNNILKKIQITPLSIEIKI